MKLIIGSAILGCALLVPASLPAQEGERQQQQKEKQQEQQKRYYDPQSKDWHTWDSHENDAYTRYEQENHREMKDFNRLSKRDQAEYFKWRHEHPDDRK